MIKELLHSQLLEQMAQVSNSIYQQWIIYYDIFFY